MVNEEEERLCFLGCYQEMANERVSLTAKEEVTERTWAQMRLGLWTVAGK